MSNQAPNFKRQDSQPWYKNYMVIIFVIGMPAVVVIACIWFVYYSYQIRDSVVRDDWYMDGKTLYHDVGRDKLTYDLDLHGKMQFSDDGDIAFYLNYPEQSLQTGTLLNGEALTYPDTLDLSISHATDIKKDRDAVLKHQQGNKYTAQVDLDEVKGKYYLQVSYDGKDDWRMQDVAKLPRPEVSFDPLPVFAKS
ncbi:FixH family protein [Psychrobacter sp. AOP22-C1-22]|uniref:FixH family protein n=1 Tax=unclassified Psychrobacter TaxID=196806 RepID=UPI0017881F39|nr:MULTISPECIES: FixH family protein [unclassified Psychrobacter]MBE0406754.1 FixH family protein [Psychrobacter sp. FME6]MBE0444749.1 FixH family protein [Psychrobacter sp. FME5]MDN5802068.1 FixH family protein [Psychrobacter sp.]MDN5892064.1 FixH family protein [Psychrobacter sp.]